MTNSDIFKKTKVKILFCLYISLPPEIYVLSLVGVVGYHVGLIRDRAWREAVISGGRQFDPGTGQSFLNLKTVCRSFFTISHASRSVTIMSSSDQPYAAEISQSF